MAKAIVQLENIRNVSIRARVMEVKDHPPKVVTSVGFEYDGEPSEMEDILILETQGQSVNADFSTPQLPLNIGNKENEASAGDIRD